MASRLQIEAPKLWHYWTKDPEGLAKWANHAHPWTALHRELLAHGVPRHMADGEATNIYVAVFGHGPGKKQ